MMATAKTIAPGRPVLDWPVIFFLAIVHVGALAALLPGAFSWPAIGVAVFLHWLSGGIPGRDLLDRLVATKRLKRNLGLEIRRKSAPFRHLVSLRYPVEYTLAPCPIFWDHLTSKLSYAECMKHFRKVLAPALKNSPATSIKQIQTGPNSGIMILEFEGKRALIQHEKMIADTRTAVGKELKLKVKLVDGPVTWSR